MTKVVRKLSRQQWAKLITADFEKTVEDFLKLGHDLIAAKEQLDYGEFLKMVENDLPFSARSAQRYMKVAGKLAKYDSVSHLPFSVQNELARLPVEAFEQAAASGAINPEMTRADAVRLVSATRVVSVPTEHKQVRYVSVGYAREESEPPVTITASPIRSEPFEATMSMALLEKIGRLEKVVKDLSIGDEFPPGSEVARRIAVAIDALLLLVCVDSNAKSLN